MSEKIVYIHKKIKTIKNYEISKKELILGFDRLSNEGKKNLIVLLRTFLTANIEEQIQPD